MLKSLCHLALAPALVAQAPLDPQALSQEYRAAFNAANEQWKAARKAGQSMEAFQPDWGKALGSVRAKRTSAKGELKDAYALIELFLVDSFRKAQDPALLDQVRAIPASSAAWQLRPTGVLQFAQILPEGYAARVEKAGHVNVRAALAARAFRDLMGEGKLDEAKALVARLEQEFPGTPTTKECATTLKAELATAVGQMAPAFAIPSLDDPKRTLNNASFKGRYVLLDFWGTWCGWCVKELPTTHRLYAQYAGKGLEILSLASEDKGDAVQAFRKKPGTPMPWKHAILGRGAQQHRMVKDFGVMGYPTLFLIGPDGRIAARGGDLREEKLGATLAKFLGK